MCASNFKIHRKTITSCNQTERAAKLSQDCPSLPSSGPLGGSHLRGVDSVHFEFRCLLLYVSPVPFYGQMMWMRSYTTKTRDAACFLWAVHLGTKQVGHTRPPLYLLGPNCVVWYAIRQATARRLHESVQSYLREPFFDPWILGTPQSH